MTYDIGIIGAGAIGLAAAYEISKRKHGSIAVIEAKNAVATEQTGHNSGVIHSGLYYKPGSVKAKTCTDGREAMFAFCRDYGIPFERCGKIVVATAEDELDSLAALEARGKANGLKELRRVGRDELRELEPNVAGIAALHVPETGIVDYGKVAEALAQILRENCKSEIRLSSRVLSFVRADGVFRMETTVGEVRTRIVINCAGLQSDRIASMTGVKPRLRIVPFRGEYYSLRKESRNLVRNLIYPVPDPRFPFLGVHFTRRVDGSVEAGPNAVLALKREGYTKRDFSMRDTLATLLYPGFWKLANKYWRTGINEIIRSYSKQAFVRSLQKLVPAIGEEDLEPGGAGVRAQALTHDGQLIDDFQIIRAKGMIHVLNAPSPAATASLRIGQVIADMLDSSE